MYGGASGRGVVASLRSATNVVAGPGPLESPRQRITALFPIGGSFSATCTQCVSEGCDGRLSAQGEYLARCERCKALYQRR
jgi:hypothetical protein